MSRLARFKVTGPRLDGAMSATIIIDRVAGVIEVRPRGRRYTAVGTLNWVAEALLFRRARTIAAEKRAARRARRSR